MASESKKIDEAIHRIQHALYGLTSPHDQREAFLRAGSHVFDPEIDPVTDILAQPSLPGLLILHKICERAITPEVLEAYARNQTQMNSKEWLERFLQHMFGGDAPFESK